MMLIVAVKQWGVWISSFSGRLLCIDFAKLQGENEG